MQLQYRNVGAAVRLDWAAKLGREHGVRTHVAELAARTAHDAAEEMATQCLERWTPVVAAMTQIVSAYNMAFARDVLTIVDDRSDPNQPVVTIQAGADATASLRAALDGTLICVRTCDTEGVSREMECALRSDRDDDQTAAYVLQRWMERL